MRGDFPKTVTYGYCHCGCGEKTSIAKQSHTKRGLKRGEPVNFISGHNVRSGKDSHWYGENRSGKNNPHWKYGGYIEKHKNTSYVMIHMPEHPRSHGGGYVYEHILVAEKMNGGPLPEGAVIHHVDFNGLNNDENNLMIFLGVGEHLKFHAKQRRLGCEI